jgi:hypothetical protein
LTSIDVVTLCTSSKPIVGYDFGLYSMVASMDPAALDKALGKYVDQCQSDKEIFALGDYNFVRGPQAVKGAALAAMFWLLTPLLCITKAGNFRAQEMYDGLIRLFCNPMYKDKSMNRSVHDQVHFCRFVQKKLTVMFKHLRRLSNPKNYRVKYQECTRRLQPEDVKKIEKMCDLVGHGSQVP